MNRREVIALIAGAALSRSILEARSADRVRKVAVLMAIGENDPEGQARVAAFTQALEEIGWTEGKNVNIEWRWSAGQPDRLKQEASEIVLRRPDVIVAVGTPGLHAVHKTALSTPIVFVIVNDPVGQGFVANLARPGRNITGFTFLEFSTLGKSMQVLRDLTPQVTRAVLMFNPEITPYYRKYLASVEAAPHSVPLRVISVEIRSPTDIDQFFSMSGADRDLGVVVPPDPFAVHNRSLIISLAARHRTPCIYAYRQFVREGGLISYAPNTADVFRRSASYVDRILKGANPAELPVQSPVKFELALNLITAKALGLSVPLALQAQADEVIE